jgi:serine/threonine-protein kinase
MSRDATQLVGRVLDGTYRIVRPLARGGMGAICEAVNARLAGKRYAVKVLHPIFATNEEVFRRFRREAEIASQLGHEHIVEVQDFNVTTDSIAYMVMELLEGEDLAARIARGPLPAASVARIIEQVASALGAAHSAGIVHRDLKPQNIFLISRGGSDQFVKVLDFGISKVQDSGSLITCDQTVMGTPFYMSPEQAVGDVRDVDARTDVFALGAIIWEMFTGEMAFASDSIPGALYKVVHEHPRPVHELRRDLPRGMSELLARAMDKDRSMRPASAHEVAAELTRLVGRVRRPSAELGLLATASPAGASGLLMPAGTVTTMSSSVGQLDVAPQPRRRLLPWAAGAGSLLAAALAFMVLQRDDGRRAPDAAPRISATPIQIAPPTDPPPTRAAPQPVIAMVQLRFDVQPTGIDASVRINGKPIGGFEATWLRSSERLEVTVAARGYKTWVGEVVPDRELWVYVTLTPRKTVTRAKREKAETVTRVETPAAEGGDEPMHVEPARVEPPALPPPLPPPPTPPPPTPPPTAPPPTAKPPSATPPSTTPRSAPPKKGKGTIFDQ